MRVNKRRFLLMLGFAAIPETAKTFTLHFFNEDPVYINYTSSAFGFIGRNIYQSLLGRENAAL